MKTMVSELTVNTQVLSFFFVSEPPQVRKTKKDKDYMCLKLQDKTGLVDGRVWDYPQGFDPASIKKGSFIKIKAQVSEYNDVTQLAIDAIRLANDGDALELGDFFERCERDPRDMWNELFYIVERSMPDTSKIKELLINLYEENKEKILQAPAAKSTHHAYLGGLLEHVLSMATVATPICDHYRVNKELVVAACMLHDIGKIHELTFPIGISYSIEGTLLGHISMGMEMVSRAIDKVEDFPPKMRMALLHLIASHHGLLEYGSPKVPLMKEAVVFHLIDMLDAKAMICDKAIKKGLDDIGLTEWVKELGGPLYVLRED